MRGVRSGHYRVVILLVAVIVLSLSGRAFADPARSQRWFASLSLDERADIQGHLVMVAQYGGMVDGAFGPATYHALTAWQSSISSQPTGVLTARQIDLLTESASEAMSRLGMQLIEDVSAHLAIMLPMGFLTERSPTPNGTLYQHQSGRLAVETFWHGPAAGGLAGQYELTIRPAAGRRVTYQRLLEDRYVVSGYQNGNYFYEFVHVDGAATAGFRFTYDETFKTVGGVASVFAASYSAPMIVVEAARQPPVPLERDTTDVPNVTLPAGGRTPQSKSAEADGVNQFGSVLTFASAPEVIALVGDIGPSTPLDFRRALRSMEAPAILVLASNGGLVASALMVAYEVAELGLATYVLPDTGCYSACAFIFLAGKERFVGGELGVHQVWGEGTDASSAQTTVSDILEAFGEFGVRPEVTSAMLRTRPEDIYVFSREELSAWNLNTR